MKIIYGICSWGLGHSTRSLPVIRKLIEENNKITIISNGRALELLKKELADKVQYIDIPDYPMLISDNSRQFIAKSIIYWPLFIKKMESGLQKLTKIVKKNHYDIIISDGRYDIYNKEIPSFFISHQMRIMNPLRIKFLETGSEIFNKFFFKRFKGVIVPDYKEDDLSGDLSHNLKKIDTEKLNYVGVLSDFKNINTKKDIDYLISISGPEPQRTIFEKKILSQLRYLNGNIIITLGKSDEKKEINKESIKIYSFLNKDKREDFLNRAKIVISRSGYSTLLDLAVTGTKALLTPTPGQIEQEYLSEYHNEKGTFYSVDQKNIDLRKDIIKVNNTTGIKRKCNVEKTVEKIMTIINSN
ncbi:glycosyltransferase family protein [Thermoplasmatota archaeon]